MGANPNNAAHDGDFHLDVASRRARLPWGTAASPLSSATTTLTAVIGGVALEVRVGDLLDEVDADALVNAANAALRPGGGVCRALHTAAGSGLAEECAAHVALDGPVAVGGAAITTGGDLPVPWLHPRGRADPRRDDPALLEAAYRSALALAEAAELATVAFPLLAAGIYGCPPAEALARALRGLRDHLADGHPTTRAWRAVRSHPAGPRPLAHRLRCFRTGLPRGSGLADARPEGSPTVRPPRRAVDTGPRRT